jgi:citrate lyase beta subunit
MGLQAWRLKTMAAPRRIIDLAIGATDLIELEAIARSRTDWACRVQRARILLAYHADPSTYTVGKAIGVTHQTVQIVR